MRTTPRTTPTRLKTLVRFTVSLATIGFFAANAQAYFSTIDTGEIIAADQYQISIEPQLVLNRYDGTNAVMRFDTGLDEASSVRGILGFGKVDFELGGMYKYVPFPDLDKQPAIGFEAGAVLARVNGGTEFSLRFHPLISKRFATEVGDLIPYASLPFGITSRTDQTVVPIQLGGGAEFRPLNYKNWSFFGELGINLNQSFSYLSLAAAWRFNDSTLSAFKK
jgi:hypothetical protein